MHKFCLFVFFLTNLKLGMP